jgi:hypothetical protein
MPFDRAAFRLERVHVQMGYAAAFNFWNYRGVLAERWGHGPIFGALAQQLGTEQVTLTPPTEAEDQRLQAVYGLKEAWITAEGQRWTEEVRDLAKQWLSEVHEVLQPRQTVRVNAQLFGLYPVGDPIQVSRRLRGRYYRNENLAETLRNASGVTRTTSMRQSIGSSLMTTIAFR